MDAIRSYFKATKLSVKQLPCLTEIPFSVPSAMAIRSHVFEDGCVVQRRRDDPPKPRASLPWAFVGGLVRLRFKTPARRLGILVRSHPPIPLHSRNTEHAYY